jgi:hypothetical protein
MVLLLYVRSATAQQELIDAMGERQQEAYVWFVRDPPAAGSAQEASALRTFQAECPTRIKSGVYGCAKIDVSKP